MGTPVMPIPVAAGNDSGEQTTSGVLATAFYLYKVDWVKVIMEKAGSQRDAAFGICARAHKAVAVGAPQLSSRVGVASEQSATSAKPASKTAYPSSGGQLSGFGKLRGLSVLFYTTCRGATPE